MDTNHMRYLTTHIAVPSRTSTTKRTGSSTWMASMDFTAS